MRVVAPIAATFASLSRFHIVLIAAGGSLVFGWLLTGRFWPLVAAVVALDWFLVNLTNRVVDVPEDRVNRISATEYAWTHRRGLLALVVALLAGSFALHAVWLPWLVPVRAGYHLLGLVYNVRLLPAPGGRRVRLKALLATKNAASNLGFLITLFGYPLAALPLAADATPLRIALLVLFFAPFEYSFEVIYDLRDVAGDRAAGVRTWPVARGEPWARGLVVALNVIAIHVALWAAAFGVFGLKDAILAVGPAAQLALFAPAARRAVTPRDCVRVTWAFTAMLFGYVGWVLVGLPTTLTAPVPPAVIAEAGLPLVAVALWWSLRGALGDRGFLASYAAIAVAAWAGEHTAVVAYGFYGYDPSWTVFAGAVPLAVALIWPLVVLSVWHLLRRAGLRGGRLTGAGFAVVFGEALFVEIAGVHAGLWAWEGTGPFGVPVVGLLGWAAFGAAALWAVERRGPWLVALPALGLAAVHGVVLATWHAGLDRLSYTRPGDGASLVLLAGALIAVAAVAWRARARVDLGLGAVPYRLLAAELLYGCLAAAAATGLTAPTAPVWAAALLFALPYLALFRWSWALP